MPNLLLLPLLSATPTLFPTLPLPWSPPPSPSPTRPTPPPSRPTLLHQRCCPRRCRRLQGRGR